MSDVVCHVCFRHCKLKEGDIGFCGARACRDGKSVCDNYGRITSIALDPVEKKPLARFMSGKMVLSVGSYGCNMNCRSVKTTRFRAPTRKACRGAIWLPTSLPRLQKPGSPTATSASRFTFNEPMISWGVCARRRRGCQSERDGKRSRDQRRGIAAGA